MELFLNTISGLSWNPKPNINETFNAIQLLMPLIKSDLNIIHSKNMYGENALIIVARSESLISDILIKFLLDAGIDINSQDPNGFTPLMIASMSNSKFTLEILINSGADLNMQNANGYTALMLASMFNCATNAELLINSGADLNIRDLDERNALELACVCAKSSIMSSVIELLLNSNCDINHAMQLTVAYANPNMKNELMLLFDEFVMKNIENNMKTMNI